jgi:signal transduction histidine kinase
MLAASRDRPDDAVRSRRAGVDVDRLLSDQAAEDCVAEHCVPERLDEPSPDEVCTFLAHELRSPLSTIAGYVDLLAHDGVGPVTEEQREFLDVVGRNVDRLSMVVNDWYELSRLEAGKLELARVAVDLEEIADRAVAELRPRIRSKEQQVRVDVAGPPCLADGDPRALQRVVGNLLSNACKYTPPAGSIHVSLESSSDGMVRLEVADTGIGIRDEDLPHICRKFFRASLTESEPGSGLGLTLVKALIEQMGGRLLVQSELGRGSRFTIVMPTVTNAVSGEPSSAAPSVAQPTR